MTSRMEAFCCSETSGTCDRSTERRLPEELNLHEQNCGNVGSRKQCVALLTLRSEGVQQVELSVNKKGKR